MEIAAFVIAVAGFLMSTASWFYNAITQRKMSIIRINGIKAYSDVIFLRMSFVNASRLPILITRFALVRGETVIECTAVPVKVASHTNRHKDTVLSHIALVDGNWYNLPSTVRRKLLCIAEIAEK